MLAATRGINTHKGALFSLGLAVAAISHISRINQPSGITPQQLSEEIAVMARDFSSPDNTHGYSVRSRYPNVASAVDMAQSGYKLIIESWLPYYRSEKTSDSFPELRLLLKIMTQLDDTNIYHRTDDITAQRVKEDAQRVLDNFSTAAVEQLNEEFIHQNLSPGGSADMLALTLFFDIVTVSRT